MTVSELIEALKEMPGDAIVRYENTVGPGNGMVDGIVKERVDVVVCFSNYDLDYYRVPD